MNTLKLAIVISHPTQYYSPVFQALAKRINLKVYYSRSSHLTYDRDFQRDVQWDIPLLEGYDYEYLSRDFCRHIRAFNPDRLLLYGWAYARHLKILRVFHQQIPIYFRGDSNLLQKPNPLRKALRMLALNWVYRHVDKAFYTGTANRAYFLNYGLKAGQLEFAGHAIDNERFQSNANNLQQAELIRSGLGISSSAILILFAGKFSTIKNPMLLLKAFIAAKAPETALLFVGNGALECSLKKLASKHPEASIHFLPFQNQSCMPAIYQACDLFCMPSLHETWGLAINEAMASGKAIISSDRVGCAQDLLIPGNSLIFKSDSMKELTRGLLRMTQSKSRLQDQGKSSLEIIANWTINEQVNGLIHGIQ